MLNSVKFAGKYTDGIKLQLLHILKGTDLHNDYMKGKLRALTLEEYVDILCDWINILPKNVGIPRLPGDGAKKLLVAPRSSGNKNNVLITINKALE